MEEQPVPVQQEPAIVASRDKHSLSKKQKIWLSVAGIIALAGIGLGSLTFYDQVILNAAGEESLGSNVIVDLPATNESPYFKILWVSQQDVGIQPSGGAANCRTTQEADGPCDLAQGWRLEQSNNPADNSSWKTIYQVDDSYHDSTTACGLTGSNGAVSLPIIVTGLRHVDGSGTGCTTLDASLGYANPALMQPNTDYYFRAAKRIVADNTDNTATDTWEPQGPSVLVHTKTYPELSLKQDGNQLVFSWTASSGFGSGNNKYSFAIARSTNPDDFTNASINTWDEVSKTQQNNRGIYAIDRNRPQDADFAAGQKTITQNANTTYYYMLVAWQGYYDNNGVILRPVSQVFTASTNTAKSTGTIVDFNVSPATIQANKVGDVRLKATTRDTCTNTCDIYVDNKISLKTAAGISIIRGLSGWTWANNIPYVTVSDDKHSLAMSPISSTYSTYTKVDNALPGKYTLKSEVRIANDATQTVETPITLTKVTPNISASYKASSVKYKSDVVINIKNAYPINYSVLPSGKLIVKNLNTKKTIKEITLGSTQTTQKITLKGVKKGKYNLAVLFQADSKKGIFENQTINLPLLTVK